MQRTKLLFPLVAILLAIASSASAQRGGTGGAGGMSGFGGMSGMSSGMGGMSGGMSGMSGGMGGMSGGMGGMSGMSSGMGGMGSGFGSSGLGGTGMGQSGMGMTQQGNQAFIGRDSTDMTSVFNQLGRNSNQFFQQMNRNMSRGNRANRGSQEENAALAVRVRLDVAFDRPQVQPMAVGAAVRSRLENVLTRRKITAPNVEVVGDTVVLRGVAASESQRLVIEKLVSLEPGVMTVENQMTVAQSTAEQSPLSPPIPPQADN